MNSKETPQSKSADSPVKDSPASLQKAPGASIPSAPNGNLVSFACSGYARTSASKVGTGLQKRRRSLDSATDEECFRGSSKRRSRRPSDQSSASSTSATSLISSKSGSQSRFYQSCVYLPIPDRITDVSRYLKEIEEEAYRLDLTLLDRSNTTEKETLSQSQPVDEETYHREFCRAVWKIGVEHATPSVLYYGMQAAAKANSTLSMDRVKSHLQKYRQYRPAEEKRFLHEYDLFLGYLKEVESRRYTEGGLHLLRLESLLGGKAAAHATHSLLLYDASLRKERQAGLHTGNSESSSRPLNPYHCMLDRVYTRVLTPEGYGAGRLFLPQMTNEEAASSLGASLKLVHGLLHHMNNHLSEQRSTTKRQLQSILESKLLQQPVVASSPATIFHAQPTATQQQTVVQRFRPRPESLAHRSSRLLSLDDDSSSGDDSEQVGEANVLSLSDNDNPFASLLRDLGLDEEPMASDTLPQNENLYNSMIQQENKLVNQVLLEFEESAMESLEMDGIQLSHVKRSNNTRSHALPSHPHAHQPQNQSLTGTSKLSRLSPESARNMRDRFRGLPQNEHSSGPSVGSQLKTRNGLHAMSQGSSNPISSIVAGTLASPSLLPSPSLQTRPASLLFAKRAHGNITTDVAWDDSSIESNDGMRTNTNNVDGKLDEYMDEILKLDTTLRTLQKQEKPVFAMNSTSSRIDRVVDLVPANRNLNLVDDEGDESSVSEGGVDLTAGDQYNRVVNALMDDDLISLRKGELPARPRSRSESSVPQAEVSKMSFQELMTAIFPGDPDKP